MSAVADPIGILAQARSDCVVGAKPSPRRPCFAWPDRRSIASTARRNRVHGGLSRPLEKTALARGFTCRQCRMHGRMVRVRPSAQPRLPMRDRRDERGRAAGQPPLPPDPARGAPAQALVAWHTQRRGQARLSRPLLGRIHVSLQPPDFLVARNRFPVPAREGGSGRTRPSRAVAGRSPCQGIGQAPID